MGKRPYPQRSLFREKDGRFSLHGLLIVEENDRTPIQHKMFVGETAVFRQLLAVREERPSSIAF